MSQDVYLDFDEDGHVTSIELLYVSRDAADVQQIIYEYSPKMMLPKQPQPESASQPDSSQ